MLYWVAATYLPKKKKDEEQEPEVLIVEPIIVVAKDDKVAAMKITMDKAEIIKKYDANQVQIFVRSF